MLKKVDIDNDGASSLAEDLKSVTDSDDGKEIAIGVVAAVKANDAGEVDRYLRLVEERYPQWTPVFYFLVASVALEWEDEDNIETFSLLEDHLGIAENYGDMDAFRFDTALFYGMWCAIEEKLSDPFFQKLSGELKHGNVEAVKQLLDDVKNAKLDMFKYAIMVVGEACASSNEAMLSVALDYLDSTSAMIQSMVISMSASANVEFCDNMLEMLDLRDENIIITCLEGLSLERSFDTDLRYCHRLPLTKRLAVKWASLVNIDDLSEIEDADELRETVNKVATLALTMNQKAIFFRVSERWENLIDWVHMTFLVLGLPFGEPSDIMERAMMANFDPSIEERAALISYALVKDGKEASISSALMLLKDERLDCEALQKLVQMVHKDQTDVIWKQQELHPETSSKILVPVNSLVLI